MFRARRPNATPAPEEAATDPSVDLAWKIHAAIVDWTGKVDNKASFALAIESAVLGGIVALSQSGKRLGGLRGFWQLSTFRVGVLLVVCAVVAVVTVVMPQLRASRLKSEWRRNFIYFGHVRYWQPDELTATLRREDPLPALSQQLINMSNVAWKKHRRLQISLLLAVSG
jgi:Pycsar effector protein